MPPPQTSAMKIPEAFSVYLPNPSTAKLKMPPHMTEVQRPTSTSSAALTGTLTSPKPSAPLKTGRLTGTFGANMAPSVSSRPAEDTTISMLFADTLLPIIAPRSRPTSISSQYVAATEPAIASTFTPLPSTFSSGFCSHFCSTLGTPTSTPT